MLVVGIIVAVAAFGVPWQIALAVAVALFVLALSTFVRRFKAAVGNNDIEFWMISNRIMPPIVAVLPIYVMFQHLQLLDTQVALIATYTAVNLPIVVWLTRDFFAGIPLDLEESAEIDGASKFRVFFTIALPLVRSGLAATFMLVLILAWNEYLLALFLTNANAQTMPVLVVGAEHHARPAMVVHVGADRDHDRAGDRHRRLPAEAHRARPAGRRRQGLGPTMRVRLRQHPQVLRPGRGRQGPRPRSRGRRVPGAARRFGIWQDHGAAHGRGAGIGHLRPRSDRRARRDRGAAEIPRHRHGVPVLRALPAHDGVRQHRLPAHRAEAPKAEIEAAVKEVARQVQLDAAARPLPARSSRAASASASRSPAPSSAAPRRS